MKFCAKRRKLKWADFLVVPERGQSSLKVTAWQCWHFCKQIFSQLKDIFKYGQSGVLWFGGFKWIRSFAFELNWILALTLLYKTIIWDRIHTILSYIIIFFFGNNYFVGYCFGWNLKLFSSWLNVTSPLDKI